MYNIERLQTRKQRYEEKKLQAKQLPIEVAIPALECDGNVAFTARNVACLTGSKLNVIGKLPERKELMRLSGGHAGLIDIQKHSDPIAFLDYVKQNNFYMVSAELTEDSVSITQFQFPFDRKVMLVLGHEHLGVPVDIIVRSDKIVSVPMDGFGFCLNVAVTSGILLYEYANQYRIHKGLR